MIAGQYAAHDVDTHFRTGLTDNFADPFAHLDLQHLVAILCDPHDMEPAVKSRVRGR